MKVADLIRTPRIYSWEYVSQYDLMADYLLKGSGIEVVEFCKTTDPA